LPSMNHLLRAAYCIDDDLLEGGVVNACPKDASHWTPWWDVKDFRQYVISKAGTSMAKTSWISTVSTSTLHTPATR